MSDVALISSHTYRSEELQRATYPDYPHFTITEIPTMLRPSQRSSKLNVHVLSLACAAETEDSFRKFVRLLKARKAALHSKEDNLTGKNHPEDYLVKLWRKARRNGAAKAGGDARSVKALLEFWEGFCRIKDRWHGDEKSTDLLKVAGIKHHDTVRANLGHTRWEWRRFSDAKRERVLKQIEKEVRQCQTKQ